MVGDIGENKLCTHAVCQHHQAALGLLQANHQISGPIVVPALGKGTPKRTLPGFHAEASRKLDLGAARVSSGIGFNRWKFICGGNRYIPAHPLGAHGRRQPFARKGRAPKSGLIGDGGIHRARRADIAAGIMRLETAIQSITVGKIIGKVFAPLHVGVHHAKAVEYPSLHFGLHIQPQTSLQHMLQQIKPFPRIGIVRPRFEMKFEVAVRLQKAQIGKPRTVGQQHAPRQRPPIAVAGKRAPLVICWQRLSKIVSNRTVQVERPFVHQLQDHIRKSRLGEGCPIHDRVQLKRQAVFNISVAIAVHVADLVAVDHRHSQTFDIFAGHQASDICIQRSAALLLIAKERRRRDREKQR